MAEPFLKSLECSCIKGTSATCPGGGEISASLGVREGALFASIESNSRIMSPQENVICIISDNVTGIQGSGPIFDISVTSLSDICDYDIVGWELFFERTPFGGGSSDQGYYTVSSVDSEAGVITVIGDDIDLTYFDPNDINYTFLFRLSGDGPETLPDATVTKTFGIEDIVVESDSEIVPQLGNEFSIATTLTGSAEIQEDLLAIFAMSQDVVGIGELLNSYTDKVAGEFGDFYCQGKLYPSGDLPIDAGFGSFVANLSEENNLWSYINEGVYEGILEDGGDSNLLSDDNNSFIEPDTIHTEGIFQYKCELTEMNVRPDSSSFRIRVSTPLSNYESLSPPLYTLYNIRLSDPSGNLIVKYNDIQMFGDSTEEYPNFVTYSSLPERNIITESYDWERTVMPHMYNVSGYQLSFSVRAVSLDDPFSSGFDAGFQENYIIPETFYASGNNYLALDGQPLSTQEVRFISPTRGFRISAFEICNSGGYGPRNENYLPFNMAVREKGRRLERSIRPTFMTLNDYDTTIYPALSTNVWEDATDVAATLGVTNEDACGAEELVKILNIQDDLRYIKLQTAEGGGVADSGKLILKFQTAYSDVDEVTPGDFNFAFDQGTKEIWWQPSGAFNVEKRTQNVHRDQSFYDVESITLKVLAKKEVGSRDYVLDVVGYSDDKLLHVTSPSGGFIQDPSGVHLNDTFVSQIGQHPVISGFYNDNSAIGGNAISELDDYFEASGNDHYKLTQYPFVTGTEFELYEVPLKILDDDVRLGLSRDYSLSSFLENVYLDIYPLPSGASVAYTELCVRYAPAQGLNLYSQGGKIGKTQDGRSEAALYPSGMQSIDDILNAGSGYQPISLIEELPHSFTSPDTVKTNYSRRWRGVEGTVRGPYDIDQFGFGFENPVIDYPFLSGYFKFDNIVDGYAQSVNLGPTDVPSGLGTSSGLMTGNINVYQNVGWRFASGTLFEDHLPGFSGSYTTTDWTSLSNGGSTFAGNPLYGKIADAFDRVARVSGEAGQQEINFGNIDTASGFAAFVRFTPDSNVSGVGYNLFNSGVIFAKWDSASDLDFALGYKNGYLCGYAQDDLGNVIEVVDTIEYSGYQFPLNAILTYNDNESKKLKLYTDNEFAGDGFDILRASSSTFDKNITSADLVLGYADGSGVGMNMLVSEFGISTYSSGVDTLYGSGTNIVESDPDKTYKRVTAEKFLENSRVKYFDPNESYTNDRYKLWDRVNEDTFNEWAIGDFKYCEFGLAFDQWQERPNTEQIVFNIKHNGSGYSQNNDLPLLSNINSGVAYHTQMENDFLRFHLSDVGSTFRSVNRRITKQLPVGYKFSEKALVVETVVEHKLGDGIEWSGCADILPSGPKMIVSLYTKKQDPYWTPDEPNWGLVNRKAHYIKPSSCIVKLESTFSLDDLCDKSETWANFPEEPRLKDFTERYFTDDVNQMFLQYDLVYPSGPAFESKLEMHSSHVRMADANIIPVDSSGTMNLMTSGAFPVNASMTMNIGGFPREESGILPLQIQVPFPYNTESEGLPSGFSLSVSGAFQSSQSLNLFIPPQSGNALFNLNISGQLPLSDSGTMNLALPIAKGSIDNSPSGDGSGGGIGGGGSIFGMPLTVYSAAVSEKPDGPVLNLFMNASSGSIGLLSALPMLLFNDRKFDPSAPTPSASGSINLKLLGGASTVSNKRSQTMPLYINAPNILTRDMSLFLKNEAAESLLTSSVNLATFSYSSSITDGAFSISWNGSSYGTGIEIGDNSNAFLPVDNEIRGVDLITYGSCDSDSPNKAIDEALATDCTAWREETCNDGGIFRAKDTYTNPDAINFEGGLGYSGNYYGIRKFTQLIPSTPYLATMTIKTGSTDSIPVPRTFEEWEYGMCGPDWYADGSGCCTEDCDGNLVFSGVKLIADDACGVAPSSNPCVDPDLIVASGRNAGDNYGQTVSVKGDLMAIGDPNLNIPDYSPYDASTIDVSGAGAVFLYRRSEDEAGKKGRWEYLEQLMLPSGFRKDYIQRSEDNLLSFGDFSISGNKWQIGQEGRHFGESLDICSSGDREIVVVGAPRANWTREFTDIPVSSVPTAGMVFADLFSYNKNKISRVASAANKYNILWKYFSAPWNAGPDEWYAQINPKMIVLQLTYSNRNYPVVPEDESSWFVHKYIPRLDDLDLLKEVGSGVLGGVGSVGDFVASGRPVVFNEMLSGVKDAFFTAFPSGNPEQALYSGIPAIIGMFKEQSGSTAGALQYADTDGNVVNIYDEFEQFYLKHSFASGVTDFVDGIQQSGHLHTVLGVSEDWADTSFNLIEETFGSGRLSTTFTNTTLNRNFITSGVGQEWGDTHGSIVSEFQVPPASGGRVYIFENERGNFNCIQVINSPNDQTDILSDLMFGATYGKTYNDRFGHSVAISKNGETIAIGSPWQNTACNILERNDDENQRVYDNIRSWCVSRNFTDYVNHYDAILDASGADIAKTSTYDYIKSPDRFDYRNDVIFWGSNGLPTPYVTSYQYSYDDIPYRGTRKFYVDKFAGTSRMGWSCSVDDDGEIVAFGSPTDSFNEFEDVNVWGEDELGWASFHNAGAVRMFHNRKYYPHNNVVEFGRFGNLDRSNHAEERALGYYDQNNWSGIFSSEGLLNPVPWRRMDFSEIEIPQDAGLCFITTPELNAASDEIIQNIKDWLSLGDRNLVLVGNDPVWEDGGLYQESNDIINEILSKLGSRMRIQAAKDQSYSMQGCISQQDLNNNKYNATASFLPNYATSRSITPTNAFVKGVGDIRLDLLRDGQLDYEQYMTCPEGVVLSDLIINDKCEFPILGSGGDLRAQWASQCTRTEGNQTVIESYFTNIPFLFGNKKVTCDTQPFSLFDRPSQEPVPVLTTAEHLPDSGWHIPANSGLVCDYTQNYRWQVRNQYEEKVYTGEHNIDHLEFFIQESGDSTVVGNFNDFYYTGDMKDPDAKNGRDGILQATGTLQVNSIPRNVTVTLLEDSILGLVESGRKVDGSLNNSRVYVMATQWSEDDASRGITRASRNDDKNTEFYINMIRKNCNESPKGIQINGFTNRSSLNNAYYLNGDDNEGHSLGDKLNVEFLLNGGFFTENQEIEDINDQIDFVWLANPSGKPSDQDLQDINEWLDLGDKKLIITYSCNRPDTAQEIASNVDYLCSGVRITSKPLFLPNNSEYFTGGEIYSYKDPEQEYIQSVNYATDSVSGCDDGYLFTAPNYQFATSLSGVEFNYYTRSNNGFSRKTYVPISGGQDFERIISYNQPVRETYKEYTDYNNWSIRGGAAVTFPILPNSGYRVWVNWVSETKDEKFDICMSSSGLPFGNLEDLSFVSVDGDIPCGDLGELTKTTVLQPQQITFDFIADSGNESGDEELGILFTTNKWNFMSANDLDVLPPSTPRILSISGALLPVTTEVNVITSSGLVADGPPIEIDCRYEVNPARSGVVKGESRPVKHLSEIYCDDVVFSDEPCLNERSNWEAQLIEDGPVIVAEEFENFSAFTNGARRSKIIVVADSTLLQGQCPHYRSQAFGANANFIRSLYPPNPVGSNDGIGIEEGGGSLQTSTVFGADREVELRSGKNWEFTQKIRSPEAGSPAKYAAISGAAISQLIPARLWGGTGKAGSLGSYFGGEDQIDPTTLTRPYEIRDPDIIKQKLEYFYDNYIIAAHNMFPRFSGDLLDIANYQGAIHADYDNLLGLSDAGRDYILDAGIGGGLTELMKIENTDYLDYHIFNSGCPGDLFGYSVDISDGKLIVGTPYNAFTAETAVSGVSGVVQWHEIENGDAGSGVKIGADGGAGAAFIFNNTNQGVNVLSEGLPWEFGTKIKPSSINVGIYDFSPSPVDALESERGPHNIADASFVLEYGRRGDRFGLAVAIDCDMAAIGAPNHDFETLHHHIYSGVVAFNGSGLSTAFQKKSFNAEYDIPLHSFYDLAESGLRVDEFNNNSGTMILNGGAVYNYRNELTDFANRGKTWYMAEKLYAAGYQDRIQTDIDDDGLGGFELTASGSDNDGFGTSVSINRARRGDSDYTLVVGSPYHDWPTSGNHPTSGLNNAGSAYTFDAMLREQIPAIPNSGGWIDAYVFGSKILPGEDRVGLRVYQNVSGDSLEYQVSGIIVSNQNGDAFLEASGFDPSSKGFVAHRPYVDRVDFNLVFGTQNSGVLNLVTSGQAVDTSGNMNLTMLGADQANVYNNLGLYNFGVSGIASGELPSGLTLNITAPSGPMPSSLNLVIGSTQTTSSLNLRTRGY